MKVTVLTRTASAATSCVSLRAQRRSSVTKDGCALASLQAALDGDATLPEVLRAIALSPSFKTRSFE